MLGSGGNGGRRGDERTRRGSGGKRWKFYLYEVGFVRGRRGATVACEP